jgi:hypothetical protein
LIVLATERKDLSVSVTERERVRIREEFMRELIAKGWRSPEVIKAEKDRIRGNIICEQTTCAGDYDDAVEIADRIVGK